MKKARAMYIPAGGKKAVWGPVDQNVLPEGYPYKEQSETVVFDKTITTEVNEAVVSNPNTVNPFTVAELFQALTELGVEPLSNQQFTIVWDGVSYSDSLHNYGNGKTYYFGDYIRLAEGANVPEAYPFCIAINMSNQSVLVVTNNPGTYHMCISELSETIHPMAEEFLPAGVGGGVQVVTLTSTGSDLIDTSSHTGAEIREMAKKGAVIAEIKVTGMDGIAVFDGSFIAPDYGMDYVVFRTVMSNENVFNVSYFFIEPDSTTVTQKSVPQST